jgi:type IV secretion system protein VirB10
MSARDVADALEVPLETPQETTKPRGLFSRSSVIIAGGGLILILVLLAVRDLTSAPQAGVPASAVAAAAAPVNLAPPPSPEDITRIAATQTAAQDKSNREVAAAAAAPASAATAASGSVYPQPPATPGAVTVMEADSSGRQVPVVVGGDKIREAAGLPQDSTIARSESRAVGLTSPIVLIEAEGAAGASRLPGGAAAMSSVESLRQALPSTPDDGSRAGAGPGADVAGQAEQLMRSFSKSEPQQLPQPANAHPTNRDVQWLRDYSKETTGQPVDVTRARHLPTQSVLLEGTRIPVAALEAINSDLPGGITARITSPVYDSLTQRNLLVPVGTRFNGRYSSEIRPGQSRILFAFHRMVLPDGRSVDLTGAQGVDNLGRAGVTGEVDNHFLQMFGNAFAIGWLSTKLAPSGLSVTNTANGQTQTATLAGEVLAQIAQQSLQRNSQIPPTIEREYGAPFFITITKDIALEPWGTR